eukprot:scaffold7655_cov101-Isochrysis_galbana.AAC.2
MACIGQGPDGVHTPHLGPPSHPPFSPVPVLQQGAGLLRARSVAGAGRGVARQDGGRRRSARPHLLLDHHLGLRQGETQAGSL